MSSYRLGRELGRGGMGVVYQAERVVDGDIVLPAACKVISPELALRAEVVERFRREAGVGLRLSGDHPNLVTAYDLVRDDDGRLLLAMELVDGAPLSAFSRGLPLPPAIVRRVLHDCLQALAHLHAAGVVHRDVSPENILLSKQGAVKLSDFGLSKVLSEDHRSHPSFKGKAAYAGPEAIQGAYVPGADLWSLAAVAHELASGDPPFGHGDVLRILSMQTEHGPAVLPEAAPADLRALCADLAIVDPDRRKHRCTADLLAVLAEPMSTRAEVSAFVVERLRDRSSPAAVARADTQRPPMPPGRRRSRTTDHGPPPLALHPPAVPPQVPRGPRVWPILAVAVAVAVLAVALALALADRAPRVRTQPGAFAPDAGIEATPPEVSTPAQHLPAPPAGPAQRLPAPPAPSSAQPPVRPAPARRRPRKEVQQSPEGQLPSQRHLEVHLAPRSSFSD